MICPVCGDRFAPLRKDHWWFKMDEKIGLQLIPLVPNAQEAYDILFNSDFKAPCDGCKA